MDRPRRIKIECDGTPTDVRVLDADTGEDLRFPIQRITWEVTRDGTTATITTGRVRAEVVGKLTTLIVRDEEPEP